MENKIKLSVSADFKDGNLSEAFNAEGYPATWKAGEWRNISEELARRVKSSGGKLAIPEPDAKESRWVRAAAPTRPTTEDTTEHYREKFSGEKLITVICPAGFKDGSLFEEFAAINHPPWIGKNEVLDMPAFLIERCKQRGGDFSASPERIQPFLGHFQLRYSQEVEAWRAEQKAIRDAQLENQKRAELTAERMAQIEKVSERLLLAEEHKNAKSVQQLTKQLDTLWAQVRL